jgi:hypothetical protein
MVRLLLLFLVILFPASFARAQFLSPPANVTVEGKWNTALGAKEDVLYWNASPGATSYRLYLYDKFYTTVTGTTSFTAPAKAVIGGTYWKVTSVDNEGNESIPSALVMPRGAVSPGTSLPAVTIAAPISVIATPEWNRDKGQVRVTWRHSEGAANYYVLRDGKRAHNGYLSILEFVDTNALPGVQHAYTVVGVSFSYQKGESPPSAPAFATAPTGPPSPGVAPFAITRAVHNDDSIQLSWLPYPGAVDYRLYTDQMAYEGRYKYTAGGLTGEVNGIEKGVRVYVEPVHLLGPTQEMLGVMGPGSSYMGKMNVHQNGHGSPANLPLPLAPAASVIFDPSPFILSGSQVFAETFRGFKPLTPSLGDKAYYDALPNAQVSLTNPLFRQFENDRWFVRQYWCDNANTLVFTASYHLMEIHRDGGQFGSGTPPHTMYSTIAYTPKASLDISNGRVAHITWEVDAYLNGRRWWEVFIYPEGEHVQVPGSWEGKKNPTESGRMLQLGITTDAYQFSQSKDNPTTTAPSRTALSTRRTRLRPSAIDLRRRFDLYISASRVRLTDNGVTVMDAPMPGGTLTWEKMQVDFVRQKYHSSLDWAETKKNNPEAVYWINRQPYFSEYHWDNMGFEVLERLP